MLQSVFRFSKALHCKVYNTQALQVLGCSIILKHNPASFSKIRKMFEQGVLYILRCPDTVLPLDPARSGRESEVDSARLSLTIIQFTAHVILISNIHSQQAHIYKSYKSPVAMGEWRSSRRGNTRSCSCGPAHWRLGSIWSLSLRAKQNGEFGSRTERLSRPF